MAANPKQRCSWCRGDEVSERYHDEEWGFPVTSPAEFFRCLSLETMQAGLSWRTVLQKRDRMAQQFFEFDWRQLASIEDAVVEAWLTDAGLIRHRGKLIALLSNARTFARLTASGEDMTRYFWRFAVPLSPEKNTRAQRAAVELPSSTPAAMLLAKKLRSDGFKFIGPTSAYALMQSIGIVNDHQPDCWRYPPCAREQARVLSELGFAASA